MKEAEVNTWKTIYFLRSNMQILTILINQTNYPALGIVLALVRKGGRCSLTIIAAFGNITKSKSSAIYTVTVTNQVSISVCNCKWRTWTTTIRSCPWTSINQYSWKDNHCYQNNQRQVHSWKVHFFCHPAKENFHHQEMITCSIFCPSYTLRMIYIREL